MIKTNPIARTLIARKCFPCQITRKCLSHSSRYYRYLDGNEAISYGSNDLNVLNINFRTIEIIHH